MQHRIGIGHDTHRLEPGGPLKIGGVEIEFDFHLAGHSDADVLLHAITDAVLGAASLGDIGELFPDNADENKGRDSAEMLSLAWQKVAEEGWSVSNIDCIVFAQKPKLSTYKRAIAIRVGQILGLSPDCIGVKAKTGEGVGDVGTGKIIQAQCVALLFKQA